MKRIMLLLSMLGLTACGVDGEPVRPTAAAQVTMSSGGVHLGTTLGARRGPFAVSLGLGL